MKVSVKVATGVDVDETFYFSINRFTTGAGLMKKVVSHPKLHIYGAEWLGLQYLDTNGANWLWLRSYKRVLKHGISTFNPMLLSVLYFPLDVRTSSLFCSRTIMIFYRCVQEQILSERICTATPRLDVEDDIIFRLAALSLQIRHGNWNRTSNNSDYLFQYRNLLPDRFYAEYPFEWKSRLCDYHKLHIRKDQQTAINEYLKLAQTLTMYGVHYFRVGRKTGAKLKEANFLGIYAGGINIYNVDDKRNPTQALPWSDIISCSYRKTRRLKYRFIVQHCNDTFIFSVGSKRHCKLMRMVANVNRELYEIPA